MLQLLGVPAAAFAAVNVSFSSYVPNSVQAEFISSTTGQFLSTVTPNPYFQNTFSLVISGKNPAYQPPIISSPILTATAVDECQAYGFGQGLDTERWYNQQLIYQLQGADYAKKTCGFQPVAPSTAAISVSTQACASACYGVYNVIASSINQRWGYVYSPTGVQVAP